MRVTPPKTRCAHPVPADRETALLYRKNSGWRRKVVPLSATGLIPATSDGLGWDFVSFCYPCAQ